jgi:hypothetical protein
MGRLNPVGLPSNRSQICFDTKFILWCFLRLKVHNGCRIILNEPRESVDIATVPRGRQPRSPGSLPENGKRFSLLQCSQTKWGQTQFHIQCVTGLKKPGLEVDHSPPTTTEIKNDRSYTSTPVYVFMELTGLALSYFT